MTANHLVGVFPLKYIRDALREDGEEIVVPSDELGHLKAFVLEICKLQKLQQKHVICNKLARAQLAIERLEITLAGGEGRRHFQKFPTASHKG